MARLCKSGCLLALGLGLVLQACVRDSAAGPFPASQWQYRSPISLNNALGNEDLVDFPVLVALDSSNFDFTKAKSDGSDIRFADSNNAALSYEIEKWDSSGQQAAVWVKVPQVDQTSTTDHFHMLYGNPAATDAQNAADVWSNGYKGVWHMDGSGTAYDSTSSGHDGTVIGSGVSSASGVIGDARGFDGTGSRIDARNEDIGAGVSSLDAADNVTVSYWMNALNTAQPSNYTRTLDKNASGAGWEFQQGGTATSNYLRIDTSDLPNQQPLIGNSFDGAWHLIGVTMAGGAEKSYLDGNSPTTYTYLPGAGFSNTGPLSMGAGGGRTLNGTLDEVRFADVVRSDAWMNAEYRSQTGALTSTGAAIDRQSAALTGLVAQYTHEWVDPLADTTGHGHDATNHGVVFTAPTDSPAFQLGDVVGQYSRNQYLELPPDVVELGESFTFTALVKKSDLLTATHHTILGTNRFRLQYVTEHQGGVVEGREDLGELELNVTTYGGGIQVTGSGNGSFDVDQWYFVALRYDATTDTIEGFLSDSETLGSPAFSLDPTNDLIDLTGFHVGFNDLSLIGGSDGWTGLIDGVRFYGSYLDNQQLQDVLLSYVPEPSACLLLIVGAIGLAFRRRGGR